MACFRAATSYTHPSLAASLAWSKVGAHSMCRSGNSCHACGAVGLAGSLNSRRGQHSGRISAGGAGSGGIGNPLGSSTGMAGIGTRCCVHKSLKTASASGVCRKDSGVVGVVPARLLRNRGGTHGGNLVECTLGSLMCIPHGAQASRACCFIGGGFRRRLARSPQPFRGCWGWVLITWIGANGGCVLSWDHGGDAVREGCLIVAFWGGGWWGEGGEVYDAGPVFCHLRGGWGTEEGNVLEQM